MKITITATLDLSKEAADSMNLKQAAEIWEKLLDNESFVTGKEERLLSISVKFWEEVTPA